MWGDPYFTHKETKAETAGASNHQCNASHSLALRRWSAQMISGDPFQRNFYDSVTLLARLSRFPTGRRCFPCASTATHWISVNATHGVNWPKS